MIANLYDSETRAGYPSCSGTFDLHFDDIVKQPVLGARIGYMTWLR